MQDINNKQNILMAEMKKDIEYIKKGMDSLTKSIDMHIKECDTKYADKWTESVIKFIMGAFGVGIIGAIIALILK